MGFILWTEGEPTNVPWALLYCTTMVVTQYKTNMIVGLHAIINDGLRDALYHPLVAHVMVGMAVVARLVA